MKKHHLLLLIISLLIAASFMFPENFPNPTPVFTNDQAILRSPTATTGPAIIVINDANDMPTQVIKGDTLYLKTVQNELSAVQNSKISHVILTPITTDQKRVPLTSFKIINMIPYSQDTTQEYYEIPMDTEGTFSLSYTMTPVYGQYAVTASATQRDTTHSIEVLRPTPKNINEVHTNGNTEG